MQAECWQVYLQSFQSYEREQRLGGNSVQVVTLKSQVPQLCQVLKTGGIQTRDLVLIQLPETSRGLVWLENWNTEGIVSISDDKPRKKYT